MLNIRTYITGFGLSVALTFAAFALAAHPVYVPLGWVLPALMMLALVQLAVQLVFFLHIREEQSPRWNFAVLLFAILIVGIVVGGSLWIMQNLTHMQMSAEEIFEDEAILPSR